MEKQFDVIAMGELLIDFTESGKSNQGNILFEANPGGAPCNVLAMLNKLGKKTSFLGMVGNDQFGNLLKDTLINLGIDCKFLYQNEKEHTTLAFVHTMEGGERDFTFYRNPGADMMLDKSKVDESYIQTAKIFHYGSLSMTNQPVRDATYKAIESAKKSNLMLSFDPNLRPLLWKDENEAKEQIKYGLSKCDLLKISEEELEFVTGNSNVGEAAKSLRRMYPNIQLMNVTMGKKGSIAYYKENEVFCPGIIQNATVETTGAGDTFAACIINYILEHDITSLSEKMLYDMLYFANGAASLITTKKGALCSMPEEKEIQALLNK